MTRKEIREFGQHIVDKLFHKKEQTNTIVIRGWIARDSTHNIYFYNEKPIKGCFEWSGNVNWGIDLRSNDFPQISWEDDNPTACEIVIKIEK